MGKRLDFIYNEPVGLFLTAPASRFPEGDGTFDILYEIINSGEEDEEYSDNIVGYEVADMLTISPAEIPEIEESYDLSGTDLVNMRIKDIVMAVKKELL
jgi:hypothetical protein